MPARKESQVNAQMRPLEWLICAIASLGFAFDVFAVLVLPLVVRPALAELGGLTPGTPVYAHWTGILFWIPAVGAGIFGLMGGYFTDRFGRLRLLTWSLILYGSALVGSALTHSLITFLVCRIVTFAGISIEFVAGIAWLAELFPDPKRREAVLGYTQACSSLGGVLAAAASYLANHFALSLVPIFGSHAAWRYTMLAGILPLIPLAIVRPMLPESGAWRANRSALRRPRLSELFRSSIRKTTIATTVLVACGYAAGFGGVQQLPQIVPGLAEVARLAPAARAEAVASVQFIHEMGGLVGRLALAALAMWIVSRRRLLRLFLVPALILAPVIYGYTATHSLFWLKFGVFFAGFFTVAQFSFYGNYLPRVFPTHLRGTGEGFAANVGGRMIGTFGAYATANLAQQMPVHAVATRYAWAAAILVTGVYIAGFAASFFLPEPMQKLPE